jgi:hypothetical protein
VDDKGRERNTTRDRDKGEEKEKEVREGTTETRESAA